MFSLGNLLSQDGFQVRYTSAYQNKIKRLLDMLYQVYRSKKTTDYVLIDTYSTQNFYYAYLTARLCQLLKLPYVPILHGGNLPNRLVSSPKMAKRLFTNAYVNVSPSLYLKHRFEAQGFTNVQHIPNAFNLGNYDFKERVLEHINLLWVRSFSEIYNPLLAVKVLKHLIEKGYSATLCMVGPDSDGSLKQVKQYCQLHQLDVEFTGKLSKPEWVKLSKDYNVFINTSNFDNTPVSVMEAMALGLPVVSTNIGGMSYLIEHGKEGVLVAPNHVEDMTKAVLELYNNKELVKDIIDNARKKVEQFDWNVVKLRWFEVLS